MPIAEALSLAKQIAERFLITRPVRRLDAESESRDAITVVLNWLETVQR